MNIPVVADYHLAKLFQTAAAHFKHTFFISVVLLTLTHTQTCTPSKISSLLRLLYFYERRTYETVSDTNSNS